MSMISNVLHFTESKLLTALFRKLLKVLCTIQLHLADENGVKLDVFRWQNPSKPKNIFKKVEKSLKTQECENQFLQGGAPGSLNGTFWRLHLPLGRSEGEVGAGRFLGAHLHPTLCWNCSSLRGDRRSPRQKFALCPPRSQPHSGFPWRNGPFEFQNQKMCPI